MMATADFSGKSDYYHVYQRDFATGFDQFEYLRMQANAYDAYKKKKELAQAGEDVPSMMYPLDLLDGMMRALKRLHLCMYFYRDKKEFDRIINQFMLFTEKCSVAPSLQDDPEMFFQALEDSALQHIYGQILFEKFVSHKVILQEALKDQERLEQIKSTEDAQAAKIAEALGEDVKIIQEDTLVDRAGRRTSMTKKYKDEARQTGKVLQTAALAEIQQKKATSEKTLVDPAPTDSFDLLDLAVNTLKPKARVKPKAENKTTLSVDIVTSVQEVPVEDEIKLDGVQMDGGLFGAL